MKGLVMYSVLLGAMLTLGFSCEEPEIEDPNGTNTLKDTTYYINNQADFDRLAGYRLKPGSPAIDAGKIIENNGGQNFAGESLNEGTVNIGAF